MSTFVLRFETMKTPEDATLPEGAPPGFEIPDRLNNSIKGRLVENEEFYGYEIDVSEFFKYGLFGKNLDAGAFDAGSDGFDHVYIGWVLSGGGGGGGDDSN